MHDRPLAVGKAKPRNRVLAIGFFFPEGRSAFSNPDEYLDFPGRVWPQEELKDLLAAQYLPLGLILQWENGVTKVVMRRLTPIGEGDEQINAVEHVLTPIADVVAALALARQIERVE